MLHSLQLSYKHFTPLTLVWNIWKVPQLKPTLATACQSWTVRFTRGHFPLTPPGAVIIPTLPVSKTSLACRCRSLIKGRIPAASSQSNKEHQRSLTGPLSCLFSAVWCQRVTWSGFGSNLLELNSSIQEMIQITPAVSLRNPLSFKRKPNRHQT